MNEGKANKTDDADVPQSRMVNLRNYANSQPVTIGRLAKVKRKKKGEGRTTLTVPFHIYTSKVVTSTERK